jgi:hypothetical protein
MHRFIESNYPKKKSVDNQLQHVSRLPFSFNRIMASWFHRWWMTTDRSANVNQSNRFPIWNFVCQRRTNINTIYFINSVFNFIFVFSLLMKLNATYEYNRNMYLSVSLCCRESLEMCRLVVRLAHGLIISKTSLIAGLIFGCCLISFVIHEFHKP